MYGDGVVDAKVLDKLEKEAGPAGRLKAIEDFLMAMPRRLDDACDLGRVGDAQALTGVVRRIREAASYVGAVELRDVAASLEELARRGAREVMMPVLCQLDSVAHRAESAFQIERTQVLMRRVTVH